MIPKPVIDYFKRNKEAKVAHLVVMQVSDDLKIASRHAKAIGGRVSSFLRSECAVELKEVAQVTSPPSADRNDGNDDTETTST